MSPAKETKENKKVVKRVRKTSAKIPATKIKQIEFTNNVSDKKDSGYALIAKSVCIACVIMTALIVTISPSSIWILGPIIGAMVIFGIALGYFSSK